MSNFVNEQFPLTAQNKRLFCAYHNVQFLTNFCLEKQCLMPLCPSCIVEHTQQHFQEGKKPTYSNLNQALNKAKQGCYYNIIALEQYKKLNQDIYEYIGTLHDNIHFQLESKKNQIYQIINQMFKEYQIRLIDQILQNYKEKNVYDKMQALNANKYIDQQISNLYQKISLLKSDECLTALITYHAIDEQGYKESLQEFNQYFDKNRKAGKIQISIIQENLKKTLTNLCDNLLSIQSIIQNYQKKSEQQQEDNSLKSKRFGFNKVATKFNTGKISRRTYNDKQNIYTNNQQQQYIQNKQNKKILDHENSKNTQKQLTFNGQNYPSIRKQQGKIRNSTESFRLQTSIIRKNNESNDSLQYGSKKFTRDFKKQS